jgi:hypothetical protein
MPDGPIRCPGPDNRVPAGLGTQAGSIWHYAAAREV